MSAVPKPEIPKLSEPKVKEGIKKALRKCLAWYYLPVQQGLGAGGIHDFIACVPVTITPEMVGKRVGMFVSIEAKEEGMIERLRRQHAKGGNNAHLAADGVFISNRPLQTYQADGIHAASGQAWIIDDARDVAANMTDWIKRLES